MPSSTIEKLIGGSKTSLSSWIIICFAAVSFLNCKMAKSGKLETNVEIKSHADRFHEFFAQTPYEICNISPDKVPSHKLLEGEWGKVGCVFLWNYIEDGKPTFSKELTEAIDDETHSVTFTVLEGNPLDRYKSFKITLQVSPKSGDIDNIADEGSVVHLVLQYEKLNDSVPDPHLQLQLAVILVKETDNFLNQA